MVAPVTVSGGVVRLTAGRFQRATTRITPKKDKVFNRNAAPIPANAITKPASAGPTARAKLNSMPLSADAAGRSSFSTNSGKTARQVGVSNASPADRAKVRMRSSTGDILPAIVTTASATAITTIHISVNKITLRRSTMSPMAPAGRARIKNGRADAVCVRATYIGPAVGDTSSQAAPTLCMKVPMAETTSAISRLRNVDDRRGCQRLAGASLFAFAMGAVFPRYQHPLGADSWNEDAALSWVPKQIPQIKNPYIMILHLITRMAVGDRLLTGKEITDASQTTWYGRQRGDGHFKGGSWHCLFRAWRTEAVGVVWRSRLLRNHGLLCRVLAYSRPVSLARDRRGVLWRPGIDSGVPHPNRRVRDCNEYGGRHCPGASRVRVLHELDRHAEG